MDIDLIQTILYATIRTGTPLLLIALGEMVCEKSGVLNLGQEGMMLMGAVVGFITAVNTGNVYIAILAAIASGMIYSALFGFLTITLATNQVATGLALTIFGAGLSAFVGTDYLGETIIGFQAIYIPFLSDIPLIGKVIFGQDILVYSSILLLLSVIWVFSKHRIGLIIRAVGEDPDIAHSVGLPVIKTRYLCVLFGGAMAGLAGGFLSLSYTPLWSEGMTSGKGWIGLALVVFASWLPHRIMLGAYLFGFASILHLVLQGHDLSFSPNLLAILPYLVTIIILVMLSRNTLLMQHAAPQSLGKPYRPQR
jgi:ABC-type uncharacterized transport system permease subunit